MQNSNNPPVVLAMRLLLAILLTFCLLVTAVPAPAIAADAAQLFELHCSGCHINGGNIVRRGKNLQLKTLTRDQMATVAAIADLVTHGKGNMSAFSDRLTPDEIQQVSAYVLAQAQQGWKS
jgi:cytochrome c6